MRGFRAATGVLLIMVSLGMSACFFRTPLAEYAPRNRAEAKIKTVLMEYLAAKRQFDIERYLAGLHAGGRFHFVLKRAKTPPCAKRCRLWMGTN